MTYIYDEKIATPLCEIMGNHNSDKGNMDIINSHHNYTTFYYSIFKDIQYSYLKIFELGIGTNNINISSNMGVHGRPGASLYGWNEYFPDAKIYGADIDYECLFSTEKIKTFYCDQTNVSSIEKLWKQYELLESFDIIIDDGAHTIESTMIFFENSIHKLQQGGYYIIEDVRNDYMDFWEKMVPIWRLKYLNFQFEIVKILNLLNTMDNNLIVIYKKN